MACDAKNSSQLHPLSLLVVYLSTTALIHGQSTHKGDCKLSIANNKSLFERLNEYYEEDVTTIIIEYTVTFKNVSAEFDLTNQSSPDLIQPWRWYSTQGLSSSKLLLTYSFLYGTMKFILSLGIEQEDLSIDASPPGCLENYEHEELEIFLRSFLIEALNVRAQPLKDLFFCKAHIGGKNGRGFLIHRCCNLDASHEVHCQDVTIDRWVDYLHGFMMAMVVILVINLPRIIQRFFRVVRYTFTTPKNKEFAFFIKIIPEKCPQVVFKSLENMEHFTAKLNPYPADSDKIYKVHVLEAVLELSQNRIFTHGRVKFSLPRALSELSKKCQSFCGCCDDCFCVPSFCFTVLSAMCRVLFNKTLPVMLVLASPSVPILYSLWLDDLWYKDLDRAYRKRGLTAPFNLNFYLYAEHARAFVIIISLFYLLHYLLIIYSSGKVRNFYTAMFNDSHNGITQRPENQTCGGKICFICNLCFKIPPFLFIKTVWSIPCTKFQGKCKQICERVYYILIAFSACFVIIILMLGAMFLSGVVVILIVVVTFEGGTIYNFIPVAFWLAVYLWTSLKNLHKPFDRFMGTLFEADICKDLYIDSQDQNDAKSDQPINCFDGQSGFEFIDNTLRVRLNHPFLDIYRSRISKEFFYHCVSMDHVRAPGSALKNNWKAVLLFCRLGAFITFVYLVLMAYGNILFISPTNRAFVTFVAGILPSVVDKLYGDDAARKQINPSDKRLRHELEKKIPSFTETWTVRDFTVVKLSEVYSKEIPDIYIIKTGQPDTTAVEMQRPNERRTENKKDVEIWREIPAKKWTDF